MSKISTQAGKFMRGNGLHGRGLFICSQRCVDAEQAQPMQYFMKKVSAEMSCGILY